MDQQQIDVKQGSHDYQQNLQFQQDLNRSIRVKTIKRDLIHMAHIQHFSHDFG